MDLRRIGLLLMFGCHSVSDVDTGFDTGVLDPLQAGDRVLCFDDADADGHFGEAPVGAAVDCALMGLSEAPGDDCDDGDARFHPGASEGFGPDADFNCDGLVTCYADEDQDGLRPAEAFFEWQEMLVWSDDADCDDPGEARATAEADCRPWEDGGRGRNHGPYGCNARWYEAIQRFKIWLNSRGTRT